MNNWIPILSFSFLAGVSVTSCGDKLGDCDFVRAVFTAETDAHGTKASSGNGVNTLDILIFGTNGEIITSGRNESGGAVSLEVPRNRAASCYAVANSQLDLSGIFTESQFLGMKSYLKDNNTGNFEMTGNAHHTFEESGDIGISMERFAVKVVLEGITLSLTDDIWTFLGIDHIRITDIFLTNVVPDCNYGTSTLSPPSTWYNQMMRKENDADHLVYESMDVSIPNGGCHSTAHTFYTYPNSTLTDNEGGIWTERHTRLVVQAELGETICYYPITLPVLERNHCYNIQGLTITGAGSDNPDRYCNRTPLSFSVSITPWTSDEKILDFT